MNSIEYNDREELYKELFEELIVQQPTLTPLECKQRALDAVKALYED